MTGDLFDFVPSGWTALNESCKIKVLKGAHIVPVDDGQRPPLIEDLILTARVIRRPAIYTETFPKNPPCEYGYVFQYNGEVVWVTASQIVELDENGSERPPRASME